jgi:hypothetical protein
VGVSLQSYASAEDCKQNHRWGIQFQPDDVWEGGTPAALSEQREKPTSGTGCKVKLDTDAAQKSMEELKRHWLR